MFDFFKPKVIIKEKIVEKPVVIRPSARDVVEQVLNRNIEFYDYKELEETHRQAYFMGANQVLTSEVFKNELAHLVEDLSKAIIYQAQSFEEVEKLRYTINGIEVLRERLEAVAEPQKDVLSQDAHEGF